MSNTIRVSAWGIRHALGPISLCNRDQNGQIQWHQVAEGSRDVPLGSLPTHLREAFGVDEFEIPDWYLVNAAPDELDRLRAALTDEKVRITNVTLDGRSAGDGNPAFREDDLRTLENVLELLSSLSVSSARVNLMPPPIIEAGETASVEDVVVALKRLSAFAQARGIRLFIENHCELTSTPEDVIALLDAVGPELGLILDTGNIEPVQGTVVESFSTGLPFATVDDLTRVEQFIQALADRASLVHVKTYGFNEDGSSKVYDLEKVINTVLDTGYDGPITIECAVLDGGGVYETISRTKDLLDAAVGGRA
ncbi:sugar phosphate isomerase/epimerase family protein [Arthrobacter sp. SD76]|uniref:sugar phosphate isomerase/epimerase family protein n=1 Tax=Arthrobacter sp. SD76 TaxID=3415007 RepID=UPI003C786502